MFTAPKMTEFFGMPLEKGSLLIAWIQLVLSAVGFLAWMGWTISYYVKYSGSIAYAFTAIYSSDVFAALVFISLAVVLIIGVNQKRTELMTVWMLGNCILTMLYINRFFENIPLFFNDGMSFFQTFTYLLVAVITPFLVLVVNSYKLTLN